MLQCDPKDDILGRDTTKSNEHLIQMTRIALALLPNTGQASPIADQTLPIDSIAICFLQEVAIGAGETTIVELTSQTVTVAGLTFVLEHVVSGLADDALVGLGLAF